MADTLTEQAAALLGLTLDAGDERRFATYAAELVAWNAHTNLTAIVDPEGIQVRHFLDSLTVARAVAPPAGARLLDVGSGAGFPGLPLAIVFPQLQVTLLEATGKKVAFLQHVIAALGLPNAVALHGRAEEAAHLPDHRAAYDVVAARAVARLPSLLEYLLPFARVGGRCVAMKGRSAHEEADDSARALAVLGGRVADIVSFALPGVEEPHHLVVVEKTETTPRAYPRKPGLPTRKPLV